VFQSPAYGGRVWLLVFWSQMGECNWKGWGGDWSRAVSAFSILGTWSLCPPVLRMAQSHILLFRGPLQRANFQSPLIMGEGKYFME
jgi:hypothetical protein